MNNIIYRIEIVRKMALNHAEIYLPLDNNSPWSIGYDCNCYSMANTFKEQWMIQ